MTTEQGVISVEVQAAHLVRLARDLGLVLTIETVSDTKAPAMGNYHLEINVRPARGYDGASAVRVMPREIGQAERAALLWVLWHHQGGSSPVGQPIRFVLGMAQHEHMTDAQIAAAKNWRSPS